MTPPPSAWSAIRQVLGPGRRAGLAGLLALMVFGMLLELAGVGLVIPVIQLLSGPVPRPEATLVGHWASLVGARDHGSLVRITMICLVTFFAFKLACQALVALRLAAFRYDLQADIARRLYALYLAQPFGFHVRRNSAHLISTVNNEAHDAAQATHHGLALIAELMVICGLAALLIIASPLAGIAVASLVALAAWFSLRLTRSGLNAWGVRLRHHQALKMKSLQQGLGGIKLIKLGGLEAAALDHFDGHNLASTAAGRHHATMQALPRLWLEFLAVTGLAALVLLARPPAGDPAGLVPLLALFAAAAFRLIPSANRIINGYQSLRYFGPTIGSVAAELALATPPAPETSGPLPPFEREILVDQVTYGYPGAPDPVLDAVTVRIARGSAVGFAGPSGAGKSTLLDIILGLLTPDAGQVCVDGAPITDNLRDWRGRIGYVPQTIQLADDTIRRNIAYGQVDDAISEAAVGAALRMARLEDYVASLPDGLDTVIGEHGARMSGGQRQRLGIARALYGQPSLLVLDEPTSALDPLNEQAIIETLLALRPELTVLIASHRAAALAGCDHVVQLG